LRTNALVRQPGVAQRLGLVHAAAERREDPLDRVAEVRLLREPDRRTLEAAAPFDPHRPGATHHHLLDGGVPQQRLERAEAERALGDAARELGAGAGVEHRRLAVHERADRVLARRRGIAGARQEAVAQVGGELVEVVHVRVIGRSYASSPPGGVVGVCRVSRLYAEEVDNRLSG
jgi:hypothetical protein